MFKPTLEIRTELQKVINHYELAEIRDKQKIKNICLDTVELIKNKLQCDYVSIVTGTITDELFSIMVTKDEVSLNITFYNFLEFYQAEVKTSQQELLLGFLATLGVLDAAAEANTLIENMFQKAEMETPQLSEAYHDAKKKMNIIQQRQKATLKWFLIPALIKEENIIRFLNSLNDDQIKQIAKEMCIDPDEENLIDLILGALTI